jgi:hypothetical protein
MFVDEEVQIDVRRWLRDGRAPVYEEPDIPRLLDTIAASCQACAGLASGFCFRSP